MVIDTVAIFTITKVITNYGNSNVPSPNSFTCFFMFIVFLHKALFFASPLLHHNSRLDKLWHREQSFPVPHFWLLSMWVRYQLFLLTCWTCTCFVGFCIRRVGNGLAMHPFSQLHTLILKLLCEEGSSKWYGHVHRDRLFCRSEVGWSMFHAVCV